MNNGGHKLRSTNLNILTKSNVVEQVAHRFPSLLYNMSPCLYDGNCKLYVNILVNNGSLKRLNKGHGRYTYKA